MSDEGQGVRTASGTLKRPHEIMKAVKGGVEPEAAIKEAFGSGGFQKYKYFPLSEEQRRDQYMSDSEIRRKALTEAVPFIDHTACPHFFLAQGLVLIGALSGRSKTTTGSNIVAGFLRNSNKRAVVVSNEDLSADVIDRVACIRSRHNFHDFRVGKLSTQARKEVEEAKDECFIRLEVIAGDCRYDMTCVEHVISVLEYVRGLSDVGLVLLDYYQTVTYSLEDETLTSVQVLKKLGNFLRDYGRKSSVPVVALAQLHPESDRVTEFQDRPQNDRTIFNHAFSAIEVVPNFDTGVTTFKIHKDRIFQQTGKEFTMRYENGVYVPVGGL
jgi:hypothetical protein